MIEQKHVNPCWIGHPRMITSAIDSSRFKYRYTQAWQQEFQRRLQIGRLIHTGFVQPQLAHASVAFCRTFPQVGSWLIQQTRGTASRIE
jgi:menaquinone-9 beta-reductase